MIPEGWEEKAKKQKKAYKKALNKVDKKKVVKSLQDYHDDAFSKVDCLDCAACCKNYSPRFKPPDINRISKHLKMKPGAFIEEYLVRDQEGDYVVKSTPCPFLNIDNTCSIYDKRPSDCSRFPYTDEDVFLQKTNITLKNVTFCPAAYLVIEHILEDMNK